MAAENPGTFKVSDIHDILVRVHFEDPQQVAKTETGRQIAKQIFSKQYQGGNSQNFFLGRAAHQRSLELWSLGKQDVAEFLPMMGVSDATKAEVPIDITPSMVASFFTETLVEFLSKNEEYPIVKAIDDSSNEEKIDRYYEALHRMNNIEDIAAMQNEAGIQLEPTNAYVPDSKLSAQVYFQQKDQLPKEIRFQKILASTLIRNDYERVLKPRLIRSNICFNIEAAKVTRGEGKYEYCIRPAVYSNIFYNFIQTDNGKPDLYYIGEGYGLKVKDIRKKYGKSEKRLNGLSESEIFELARLSALNNTQAVGGFGHLWNVGYDTFSGMTPWDDCTVFIIDYEIMISEAEYWVSSTDSFGKENVVQKKGIPKVTSEKSRVLEKNKDCVYNGIYCPYSDKMLYWEKQGSEFNWRINIPHNNGEYIPSLLERGMAKFKELQLIELKKRHFIGQLSPAIFDVDVARLKDVTIGGRRYEWKDIVRIRQLTGANLFSSKGLDPLDVNNSPAVRTAMQDPTLQRIIELDAVEKGLIASLRELLGLPIYVDGSIAGQRTAGRLAEGQRQASSNVTGFVTNGHNQLMEEILNRICIMAWEDVVTDEKESEEDLVNTQFKVYVKMKMTAEEKERLEIDIDRWSKTPDENGKPLLSPADCYAIRQIDDPRLAEMYLADKVAENERKATAKRKQDIEANAKSQQESNDQAAEKAIQLQQDKLAAEKEMKEFDANNTMQQITAKGALEIFSKILKPKTGEGGQQMQQPVLPDYLEKLFRQTFENVSTTLYQDKKNLDNQIIAKEQEEQLQAEEQMMQQQMAEQQQQVMQ